MSISKSFDREFERIVSLNTINPRYSLINAHNHPTSIGKT